MLETYMTEIIAALGVLVLILIYFIIKISRQKQEDISDKSEPQKIEEIEEPILEDVYDIAKEEPVTEPEPMVMEENNEAINLDSLSGEEEGSFGVVESVEEKEVPKEVVSEPLTRVKRTVPPHGKITKDAFKEFAGQRILVAEDNMINQKVLTGLFADSGIEIVIADDGQITLDILAQDSNFNFILMDAHMPRVDGFEATREIRKNSAYNHIVIIALSGDTAADDIRKMSEAGMEEQLEKPLRIEALYKILYTYSQGDSIDDTSLDIEEGLSICGYDEKFYHEILDEFINTYSDSKEKLQELFKAHKIKEADKYLLDLSGITANIGATNISKIIIDLKESLNDPKERRYVALFNEYAKSLNNLLNAIKKYQG